MWIKIILLTIVIGATLNCGGGSSNSGTDGNNGPPTLPPPVPQPKLSCDAREFARPASIALKSLVPGGQFSSITGLVFHPESDQSAYLLEQKGVVYKLDFNNGTVSSSVFIDLRDTFNIIHKFSNCFECGLYSLAFHPNFAENGWLYFSFTEGGDGLPQRSHLIRVRSSDKGESLDLNQSGNLSYESLLIVDQPSPIHNNGQVKFGPDGYLYIGFGDGGPGGDPNNNAQNRDNLLGSILRLRDDGQAAPGNLVSGRPEIFAYGLRNPWNWSFDRQNGDLWLGDVGQADIEEINIIENGENYGWPCFEGKKRYRNCSSDLALKDPIYDYNHSEGQSVTGGYVYRGTELADLQGAYIFGDFGSGTIWSLTPDTSGYARKTLLQSGLNIASFSEDSRGELYLLDYFTGGVFKISPNTADANTRVPVPELLSETGCVNPQAPLEIVEDLIPYDINEPFWSDGAIKKRFISLPEGESAKVNDDGDLDMPIGTILIKDFYLNDHKIETRLLLKQEDTGWSGYSYKWNASGSDAELLTSSEESPVQDQIWHYPSRGECTSCHTSAAGGSLGLEIAQLNKTIFHPDKGDELNQLDYLIEKGVLAETPPANIAMKTMPSSADPEASLEARAKSFLHSNCSQCHRPGGTSQSTMDLRFDTSFFRMRLCNASPLQHDFDLTNPRLLAPGDPDNSIILHRLTTDSSYQMPPLGSNVKNTEAIELMRAWISSFQACSSIVGPINASFTLQNIASGEFIGISEDAPVLVEDANHFGKAWRIRPVENYYLIQSGENELHYLHSEQPGLQLGEVMPLWLSIRWEIRQRGPGRFSIHSLWREGQVIYRSDDGSLLLGETDPSSPSAQWSFTEINALAN